MVEYLDDLLAVHRLLDEAFCCSDSLLLPDEVLGGTCADLARDDDHENDAEAEDEGHPDAVVEHDEEHRDD